MDSTELLLILEKLMLGVTLAAPIGPVSVEMIKRGLHSGFWAAYSVRIGGAIGNTLCLIGTYLGLSHLMGNPMLMNILGMLGACLLLYMGISTLRKKTDLIDLSAPGAANGSNGLLWGFYLAIFNPIALVFWPGIFAASMGAITSISFSGFLINLFVIAGVLIWGAGLSFAAAFGKRMLNKKVINILTKGAGVFMIFYGCKYAYQVLQRF